MKTNYVLSPSLAALILSIVAVGVGCGAVEESKTASECVEQTQGLCPPGTSPDISANAVNSCEGEGSADFINQDGELAGACLSRGACTVVCRVTQPCECGVKEITLSSVVCADCDAAQDCRNTAVGCAEGFSCLPVGEIWECVKRDGESCDYDGECLSGYCDNGFCCETGECCVSPSDCSDEFSEPPACDTASCTGGFIEATCEANQCIRNERADHSACDGAVVDTCGELADVTCGADGQPPGTCRETCTEDAHCDPGFVCAEGSCALARLDGQSCTSDAVCLGGRCHDGFCCDSGECCSQPSDCDSVEGTEAVCDLPGTCGGRRVEVTCIEGTCGTREVEDDSACTTDTSLDAVCGLYTYAACNGEADQDGRGCADSCLTGGEDDQSKCVTGARCIGGQCRACVQCEGHYAIRTLGDLEEVSNCGSIGGSLHIEGFPAPSIELGCLSSVQSVSIISNDGLVSVSLPNVTRLERLIVDDNSALETLSLAGLTQIESSSGHDMKITNNPALTTIDLASLEQIGRDGSSCPSLPHYYERSTLIEGNGALAELSLPGLVSVGCDIGIWENDNLNAVSLPALASAEDLSLSNNAQLTSVDLSSLTSAPRLSLYGSAQLASVDLSALESAGNISTRETGLVELRLPALVRAALVELQSNPQLTSVDLSALTYADKIFIYETGVTELLLTSLRGTGFIDLRSNPRLVSLNLGGLAAMPKVEIGHNDSLQEILLPNAERWPSSITGRSISIYGNPELSSIDMSRFESNDPHYTMEINDNDALVVVSFPSLLYSRGLTIHNNTSGLDGSSGVSGAVRITNNSALQSVELPSLRGIVENNGRDPVLAISSNENLTNIDLGHLGEVSRVTIQQNSSLEDVEVVAGTQLRELTISHNTSLATIAVDVGGDPADGTPTLLNSMTVEQNPALASITGTLGDGVSSLTVTDNAALCQADLQSWVDSQEGSIGYFLARGNAGVCQ